MVERIALGKRPVTISSIERACRVLRSVVDSRAKLAKQAERKEQFDHYEEGAKRDLAARDAMLRVFFERRTERASCHWSAPYRSAKRPLWPSLPRLWTSAALP